MKHIMQKVFDNSLIYHFFNFSVRLVVVKGL